MKTETFAAIKTAAETKAAELCAVALADLAKGRKTFVKGKPVFVPYSAEVRHARKCLQTALFTQASFARDEMLLSLCAPFYAAEGVTDAAAEDAFIAEATKVWSDAGVAEVERLFA